MTMQDQAYHHRRAREEDARAAAASTVYARQAHRALAALHRGRLDDAPLPA